MSKKIKKKLANYLSLAVAVSGAVLAVSDTITSMKLIPAYLSNAWGLFIAASLVINRVGSILTHPAHTEKPNETISDSTDDGVDRMRRSA